MPAVFIWVLRIDLFQAFSCEVWLTRKTPNPWFCLYLHAILCSYSLPFEKKPPLPFLASDTCAHILLWGAGPGAALRSVSWENRDESCQLSQSFQP